MKLKTLQDFDSLYGRSIGKTRLEINMGAVDKRQLKQEAIAWIKHWQEEIKEADKYCDPGEDTDLYGQIEVFKHFFNIESKDLE